MAEVHLFSYTKDIERVCAAAMRSCYSPHSSTTLLKGVEGELPMDRERVSSLLKKALELGHLDVLEHGSMTFDLVGISRSCSHQLVRHRLASYSQQSQRHVKITRSFGYVKPPKLEGVKVPVEFKGYRMDLTFEDVIEFCKEAEEAFLSAGVPAEDARYVRPNAAVTNITMTVNPRELLHILSLRCAPDAQWEIRDLAWGMYSCAKLVAPTIFSRLGIEDRYESVRALRERIDSRLEGVRGEFEGARAGEEVEIPLDGLLEHEVRVFVTKL